MLRAIAGIALACALLIACGVRGGLAHENPTDWIGQEKVKNGKGELCCGEGDCFPFDARQMITTPAGVAFPDEPNNIIPFNKFGPSVDKFYWRCRWGGETKCVFAPLGGV